ncbi:hypothetical protein CAOG_00416 [Capsaspora owczarzaki ATCC 30864]|nr:hypothetical protein CAOG_00416 [Capsaspora owczarzaki ATCC 30864]|eukprot:XP_004365287.1 hypothetical protein CAOG_00416 [Capsaspora owczarzaki ATCC 30864]
MTLLNRLKRSVRGIAQRPDSAAQSDEREQQQPSRARGTLGLFGRRTSSQTPQRNRPNSVSGNTERGSDASAPQPSSSSSLPPSSSSVVTSPSQPPEQGADSGSHRVRTAEFAADAVRSETNTPSLGFSTPFLPTEPHSLPATNSSTGPAHIDAAPTPTRPTTLFGQFLEADDQFVRCVHLIRMCEFSPLLHHHLVHHLLLRKQRLIEILELVSLDMVRKHPSLSLDDRAYRAKFPSSVTNGNSCMLGTLVVIAELLVAGATISMGGVLLSALKPAAMALCLSFGDARTSLRAHATSARVAYPASIQSTFERFDKAWVEFELSYMRLVLPALPSARNMEQAEEMTALLQETIADGLASNLITIEQLEELDPGVLYAIPRLAVARALRHAPGDLFMDDVLSSLVVAPTIQDEHVAPPPPLPEKSRSGNWVKSLRATASRVVPSSWLPATPQQPPSSQSLTPASSWLENHCLARFVRDRPALHSLTKMLLVLSEDEMSALASRLLHVSEGSESSSSGAAFFDTTKDSEQREYLHSVFVAVCAIADRLHSGETASAFRGVLQKCIEPFLDGTMSPPVVAPVPATPSTPVVSPVSQDAATSFVELPSASPSWHLPRLPSAETCV